jgi:hypothetical protein
MTRNIPSLMVFAISLMTAATVANAQGMPLIGPPIPTTIVISKPAPGETFGDKQVISIGVSDKLYKFVLKDAYTNDRNVRWPDIWQQVVQYRPNFQVQGRGEDEFAKIEPGQTVTITGMYAPMNHNFEVVKVEPGGGGEKSHY